MFKNYLKIAYRNLVKQKVYSVVNISGLAIGMGCCICIFLFVQDELSYDRYHEKTDQICRVLRQNEACTSYPLAPALVGKFPEIVEAVRISSRWERLVSYKDKKFVEKKFMYADPNLFKVFTFPFILGDPETALKKPFSIVITEEIAQKYFGSENPIGKILTVKNKYYYTITGVIENIPRQSHFKADFFATLIDKGKAFLWPEAFEDWGQRNAYTYLLLQENSSIKKLEDKFAKSIVSTVKEQSPIIAPFKLRLQRLTDIHLYSSDIDYDIDSQSDITYVLIFSLIAIFILLIACINYMNLSTARSTIRSKEVGVRKVSGASRFQLIKQFWGESLLFSIIAFLISIVLVELFLPIIISLTGKELSICNFGNLIMFTGIILFVGLISGGYPAIFLSAFQPIKIIKGISNASLKNLILRRILVIFQFTISIVLIIGTYVIFYQLHYLQNKKLGFDKEHVVTLELPQKKALKKNTLLKNVLLQHTNIISVSRADRVPSDRLGLSTTFKPESVKKEKWLPIVPVDYDYFKTLGIEFTEGRRFSELFAADANEAIIFNESAIKKLAIDTPIGNQVEIGFNQPNRRIIGVVKDFHFESLYEKIKPIAFVINPKNCWQLIIRIHAENIPETLDYIKNEWTKYYPEWVFEYSFLDENFDNKYKADEKVGQFMRYFTVITIIIACLGLFGLASFTAENRTKEIGIRKVLGASVSGIVVLLSKEFIKWVFLANIIAWPIAYFAMNKWLQNFAYRINIGIWTFLLAGALALVIALMTVSFQAIKAATANPVEALRYE